jgi:hypothetical protein
MYQKLPARHHPVCLRDLFGGLGRCHTYHCAFTDHFSVIRISAEACLCAILRILWEFIYPEDGGRL